jgi:hypothetical protein
VLPAALVLAAALLSGFTILRGYAPHDEGLMLAWASRVANGQWPYRDFWSNYAPGQTVLLAGLWKVFGPSLLAWRVLRVAVDAVVALLAYRLVRRAGARQWLALVAWFAVAAAMAWPSGPGPNAPALALGLGALLLAREHPRWAGALAGLAFVFRPEIGAAAVLGCAAWEVAAVAGIVAVACLAPFAIAAGGSMWHDIVGFLSIQDLQRLPFPFSPHTTDPNKVLERLFPLILVVSTGAAALWAVARRRWHPALPLAAVGLLYLLGRTDEFHLVPLSVALALILAAAAASEEHRWPRLALVGLLALVALHGLDRRVDDLLHPPAQAAVPGPSGDGVQTSPQDARALAALQRAMAARPPGPIFVADPRHDLVRVGDPLLYVLLDRRNATRYDVMQPGVVTTATVQREIVGDLARVRTVVRWLNPTASLPEPNGAGRSSGVRILDDYLAANFAPHGRFGDYELLARVAP